VESTVRVASAWFGEIGTVAIQANFPVAAWVVAALARRGARHALAESIHTKLSTPAIAVAGALVRRNDTAVLRAKPALATIAGADAPNWHVGALPLIITILIVPAIRAADTIVGAVDAEVIDATELIIAAVPPGGAVRRWIDTMAWNADLTAPAVIGVIAVVRCIVAGEIGAVLAVATLWVGGARTWRILAAVVVANLALAALVVLVTPARGLLARVVFAQLAIATILVGLAIGERVPALPVMAAAVVATVVPWITVQPSGSARVVNALLGVAAIPDWRTIQSGGHNTQTVGALLAVATVDCGGARSWGILANAVLQT